MSLNQLYQDKIKQHSQSPVGSNLDFLPTHKAEGYNASCGDELEIYLQLNNHQLIKNIAFKSDACAICTASASLLCEYGINKSTTRLKQDSSDLTATLKSGKPLTLKSMECLTAVSQYPSRINCALLPWETLLLAFNNPDSLSDVNQ